MATVTAKEKAVTLGSTLAGKYLTFKLMNEQYGLPILKVQEIIGMMSVTRVPRTPPFVRGVINLRGKVIPVVELRAKFGMEKTPDTELTCIIVVQIVRGEESITLGCLVDEVSEVRDIPADAIDATPSFGASVNTEFILGMGKMADKVVMLLDLDKAFSSDEIVQLVKAG